MATRKKNKGGYDPFGRYIDGKGNVTETTSHSFSGCDIEVWVVVNPPSSNDITVIQNREDLKSQLAKDEAAVRGREGDLTYAQSVSDKFSGQLINNLAQSNTLRDSINANIANAERTGYTVDLNDKRNDRIENLEAYRQETLTALDDLSNAQLEAHDQLVAAQEAKGEHQAQLDAANQGYEPIYKKLAECATISYNVVREKRLVRGIGQTDIKGVTKGPRCLPATEKVLIKDKGYISIADVNPGDYVQSSASTYDRVLGSYDQGLKQCHQLKLSNGYSLKGSFDHPISTPSGWVNIEDLKEGDLVHTVGFSPLPEEDLDINDDILKMIAYLIGDGAIHKYKDQNSSSKAHSISLSIADNEMDTIGKETTDILNRLGITFKDYRSRNDKCITRRISICLGSGKTDWKKRKYNILHKILLELGLYDTYSHTKFIPQEFLAKLSHRQISLFLSRLFSTDGCYAISKDLRYIEAQYTSTSEDLIDQIRLLLSKLSINCLKSQCRQIGDIGGKPSIVSNHNAYKIVISDSYNLSKFIKNVGIWAKDDKIAPLQSIILSRINNQVLDIDYKDFQKEVAKILKSQNKPIKVFANKYNLYQLHYGVTPSKAIKVANELSDESFNSFVLKSINRLLDNKEDIIIHKVIENKKIGLLPVYDLEVENRHAFVANFIIVHNTIMGSLVFTVFDKAVMHEIMEAISPNSDPRIIMIDQIPPVDIFVFFANEYGVVSKLALFGAEFMNEGQVMSVHDMYTENSVNFVARNMETMSYFDGSPTLRPEQREKYLTPDSLIKNSYLNIRNTIRLARFNNFY